MTNIDELTYLEKSVEQGKLIFMSDYAEWLNQFDTTVQQYLDTNFMEDGKEQASQEFEENAFLGYNVVLDWAVNVEDPEYNLRKLINYILKPEVFNIVLRGSPGSGKTTTMYALTHMLKGYGLNIVMISSYVDEETLPDWITWKSDFVDLEMGDFAFCDEAALKFGARSFGSKQNKEAFESMPVGRHVGAKIMFMTQMMSETDVKAMRWANISISKGYPTSAFGEQAIERKEIADDALGRYMKPRNGYAIEGSYSKDWSVCSVNNFKFMVYLPQPGFMTDKLSRTYRKFVERTGGNYKEAEKLALEVAEGMRANGRPAVVIRQELAIRGYKKSLEHWMEFTGELKKKRTRDDDMSEVDRLG